MSICSIPKKIIRLSFWTTAVLLLIFSSMFCSGVYVKRQLLYSTGDNFVTIINPSRIPIKIFSVDGTLLNERIVDGQACRHVVKNMGKGDIKVILKYCILKFTENVRRK